MATAATEANARTAFSWDSLNTWPGRSSPRYRLPNAASRMMIGTPRNARIGG